MVEKMVKTKKKKQCPDCKRSYEGYPALSRKDNKTNICPDCGKNEVLSDFFTFISW